MLRVVLRRRVEIDIILGRVAAHPCLVTFTPAGEVIARVVAMLARCLADVKHVGQVEKGDKDRVDADKVDIGRR